MHEENNKPGFSKWMDNTNPFASVKFKEKKVIRDFLTINELNMLKDKEFEIPRLEIVRDVFLFCCFTFVALINITL